MVMTPTEFPPSVFSGLDHTSPLPLYSQIAQRMEKVITDGVVPVESWLENEGALAARLRTSRATTRRALEELVRRGLLARHQGKGTQVISTSVVAAGAISGLFDDLRLAGRTATSEVLKADLVGGAAELERVRFADGRPMAILRNRVPGLRDLPPVSHLEQRGLYEILRFRGVTIRTVRQSIGGRRASSRERELLLLSKGSFVLAVRKEAFDPMGRVVDLGDHAYRLDAHTFEMTLSGA